MSAGHEALRHAVVEMLPEIVLGLNEHARVLAADDDLDDDLDLDDDDLGLDDDLLDFDKDGSSAQGALRPFYTQGRPQ